MEKYSTEQLRQEAHRFNVDTIPVSMKRRRRWVLWRLEHREGKWTKVPYQPDNPKSRADSTDPDSWGTFEQAQATATRSEVGVGYVLLNETGIDLDNAIGTDGRLEDWAAEIVEAIDSYTEISPSRTGVKIFTTSKLKTDHGHKKSLGRFEGDKAAVEVYSRDRFFTVTGVQYVAD